MPGAWLDFALGYLPLQIMLLVLVFSLASMKPRAVLAIALIEVILVAVWVGYFYTRFGEGALADFLGGTIGGLALWTVAAIAAITGFGLAARRLMVGR